MTKRILKRVANAAIAVVIAGAVVACAPEAPDPEPSYLTFASEEEAYAAAEEVYRAYKEAGDRRFDDPDDDSVFEYLIGLAYDDEIESRRNWEEQGWSTTGNSSLISFTGSSAELSQGFVRVEAEVCSDVSGLRLIDKEGNDITPEERPDVVGVTITFQEFEGTLRVSQTEHLEPERCAA